MGKRQVYMSKGHVYMGNSKDLENKNLSVGGYERIAGLSGPNTVRFIPYMQLNLGCYLSFNIYYEKKLKLG